jgi:hypothetical protein
MRFFGLEQDIKQFTHVLAARHGIEVLPTRSSGDQLQWQVTVRTTRRRADVIRELWVKQWQTKLRFYDY